MIKKITIVIVILLLIIGAGAHYLLSNLDSLVKEAIEKYGTEVTRTAVKVSSVKISLRAGEGSISGLSVGNPPAFAAKNAFEMGSISVKIDENSIMDTKGPIIISEVDIEKPTVTFEINDTGNNNLKTLQQNVQSYSTPASQQSAPEGAPAEKGQSRKVIIRDLYIREGHLNVSSKTLLRGKDISVPLSEIHLADIGKSSGGTDPSQVAKQILSAINATSIKDATAGITNQLKSLNLGNVGNVIDQNSGNVGNSLKGLIR